MKIAIVGSGISGLGAAHLFHPRHGICVVQAVFEKPKPDPNRFLERFDEGFE